MICIIFGFSTQYIWKWQMQWKYRYRYRYQYSVLASIKNESIGIGLIL